MQSVLLIAENWWWLFLIVAVACWLPHFYLEYRRRQRKDFVLLTLGCLTTCLMLACYTFSILASMFSIIGFFMKYGHHH